MQLGIFWVHVWLDDHLDAVISCIHMGACQFQWIYQGILSSSHQWIWCTWALVFLLQVVLPLLLPEWVLYLSGFCWVEWSQQHSSLGPQLTSHMLGDPREQDQVCLQCTGMSGSCMVGLQECLVTRGWGHREFHTEELETHCRWLAWFEQGPGQWAGHLGWFVLGAAVGTDRGVVCYLWIWCQSWHGLRQCLYCWHMQAVLWLCMLHWTAGNWCCQWSTLFGCTSPTVLQSIAAMNRSLCRGLFSVLALAACDSLPFLQLLNWGWWWDACRLVVLELQHFAHQWPFFPQPLHAESWAGQLCLPGGCWWVQLGHGVYDICSLGSCAWWVWHTACTAWPTYIVAAPDSTAQYVLQISSRCDTLLSWLTFRSCLHSSMLASGIAWISLCWTSNLITASLPLLICALQVS